MSIIFQSGPHLEFVFIFMLISILIYSFPDVFPTWAAGPVSRNVFPVPVEAGSGREAIMNTYERNGQAAMRCSASYGGAARYTGTGLHAHGTRTEEALCLKNRSQSPGGPGA